MKRPILTSDLPFATSVCKDAALYFNPLDPHDIVDKIIEIIKDSKLRDNLVENGLKRLQSFDSSYSRAETYLKICEKIKNRLTNEVQF